MKKISAILAACMLCSTIASVPTYAASQDVLLFETFEGASVSWSGVVGKTGIGIGCWEDRYDLVQSKIDEVSYDSQVKVTKNAYFNTKNFGKVIDSGKVHISYAYKTENLSNSMYLKVIDAVNATRENVFYDGYDVTASEHTMCNLYFNSDGTIAVTKDATNYNKTAPEYSEKMTITENAYTANEWYKADIIYDLDNLTYDAYVNGVLYGSGKCSHNVGIKGIGKTNDNYLTVSSDASYIDDIYVHEYDDKEKIYLATEGVKTLSDGSFILSLAVSEYVEGLSEYSILLSDAATGDDFLNEYWFESNTSVSEDGKLILHLPADVAGKEFIISGTGIEGSTTGATEIEPLLIRIPANTVSDGKNTYYYMNDSFDTYNGGTVPAGWQLGSGNVSDSRWLLPQGAQSSQALSAVNGKNGKGVKISGSSDMLYYYFPSITPVSGQFTIEFDVNRSDSATWNLNYVLFEDYKKATEVDVTSRMNFEMVKADANGNILYATDRAAASTDTEIDNTAGTWEHVKIDVDMGNYTYDITVGNNNKKVTTAFKGLLSSGIMGIGINGTDVIFDNFKVYKDTNMYLNDDFNTHSSYKIQVKEDGTPHSTVGGDPITEYTTANLEEGFNKTFAYTTTGRENFGKTTNYAMFKFFSSNGWVDSNVTNLAVLDAEGIANNRHWMGNTKAVALTPAEGSETYKGQLLRAEESSSANYWTKAKAEGGDKVLMLSPRMIDTNTSPNTVKQQRRITKYFDRAITPGTPFTIEFVSAIPSGQALGIPFGISLIEDGQDAITKDNLLVGYTGHGPANAQTSNNKTFSRALVAPNTNTSLGAVLDADTAGCETFKAANGAFLSEGYYMQTWSVQRFPAKTFLPYGNNMQKIIVTVTPNSDGTTSIEWKLAGRNVTVSNSNATKEYKDTDVIGTVKVNRDFTAKTFTGIAIDIMDMSWTSIGATYNTSPYLTDGSHCIMIDELKVYETNAQDVGVHVRGINAVDYAGVKAPVNDTVPNTTKAFEIEFSAPVANSIIGKEGMVSLVNANTNEKVALTGTLSEDGTVYRVEPSSLIADNSYNLIVSSNIEFTPNNGVQFTENYIKSFDCVYADAVKVYDAMIANAIVKGDGYTYDNLKPAKATTINTVDGYPTKLYINGVSADDNTSVLGIIAYYNTAESGDYSLVNCQFVPLTISESGEFEKTVSLELPAEDFDRISAYVWTDDDTYRPLINALDVEYEEPVVEE